jgi:hypothetical protein
MRVDYTNMAYGAADDQALPFADQALIGFLTPQPTLVYSEWATQTSDNSWTEQVPTVNYQAYAVSDQQLVAVANTTSSEIQTLAMLSPVLTMPLAVKTAFEGTPFAYVKTEAIYAQLDTSDPPQIYFLYWLSLRDGSDPKTGPTSLVATALALGGVLSYILEVPIAGASRARPSMSFAQAFTLQSAKSPLTIPPTPAVQQTIPASPTIPAILPPTLQPVPRPASLPTTPAPVVLSPLPAPTTPIAQSSGSNAKALLLVAMGAAAAIGTYKYIEHRRKA